MQANSAEHQPLENSNSLLGMPSSGLLPDTSSVESMSRYGNEPTCFHGNYASVMDMFADAKTVAAYLDVHHEWFHRCAHPMKAEPLGENGYALTIGQFGSFGYEIEPKIGLDLLPQDQGVYRIRTIPIPGYEFNGYEVDFQAALQLVEVDVDLSLYSLPSNFDPKNLPSQMTRVEWELKLDVEIRFPRFIQALPMSIIQTTGDRLLNQIVRQASRCLTHKVQDDFHSTQGIPIPKHRKKFPWNRSQENNYIEQS
jgi:hypothetical protein